MCVPLDRFSASETPFTLFAYITYLHEGYKKNKKVWTLKFWRPNSVELFALLRADPFKKHSCSLHFQQVAFIINCTDNNTNEDDSQSVAREEEHRQSDTRKLSFTLDKHKTL